MRRKIIHIDESKCNGCARCVTACAEGAVEIVNGKARLVKEVFCDGFGDCLGECPAGALTIEVREAPEFDAEQVRERVRAKRGAAGLQSRPLGESGEVAARQHGAPPGPPPPVPPGGGCPGLRQRFASKTEAGVVQPPVGRSELEQWPVQLHLVQPGAPCFHSRELLVLSTCAPVASAEIHGRFIRGHGVVVGCPKLDNTKNYAAKLAAILQDPTIPGVRVVRMEVPCCGGLTALVREAVRQSGRPDLCLEEVIIGLDGMIGAPTGS